MPTDAARFTVALGEPRPAEGDRPSQSRVYRSFVAKDAFPTIDVTTLYDSFKLAVERYAGQPCLGHRPVDPEDPSGKKLGPFVFQTVRRREEERRRTGDGAFSFRGVCRARATPSCVRIHPACAAA
jgi:hypothetical protein